MEGLAWGADRQDGRHLLYVISDNDLNPALPTQICAFAIAPNALPGFQAQLLPGPMSAPGQIRK
jgi:hypothetical protein